MSAMQSLPSTTPHPPQRELFDLLAATADAADGRAEQAVRFAQRELQNLLTEVFLHDEPAQRLLTIGTLVPTVHRNAWHLVTHTLLARRLALGSPAHSQRAADAHTLAWALARQWEQPVLQQRWQRLVSLMSAQQCRQLVARARRQLRQVAALH